MKFQWISKRQSCFFFTPLHTRGFFRGLHSATYPLCSHYKTLDISEDANEAEIRQAYLTMCKKYHPDVNKSQDAEAKFREVRAAYDVLSDKNLRQKYDAREKWSRQTQYPYREESIPQKPYQRDSVNYGREWRSFRHHEAGKDSGSKFEEKYYGYDDDRQKFREEVLEALRRRRQQQQRGYKMWEDIVFWTFPQKSRIIIQRRKPPFRTFRRLIWFGCCLIIMSYIVDFLAYLRYREIEESRRMLDFLEERKHAEKKV